MGAQAEQITGPQQSHDMLRFLTCGSVDDGKSTLIGRLLWDSKAIFDDQRRQLEIDSCASTSTIDFSLLLDGLKAEREQGITIDVAYRFFATERRKFIVADSPGHVQYTRNMATAASNADVAILLVDARRGVVEQTRRHACICHLMGIRDVLLAVNKMDLVDWSRSRFDAIDLSFRDLAKRLGFSRNDSIPVSALTGANVFGAATELDWWDGPTLVEYLESVVPPKALAANAPFRFPVQSVIRDGDFRGYAGTAASGRLNAGDRVKILPEGRTTRIDRVVHFDGERAAASAGEALVVTTADAIDISRGDVIVGVDDDSMMVANRIDANMVWLSDEDLVAGRQYLLKSHTSSVNARVLSVDYRFDLQTEDHNVCTELQSGDIGRVSLELDQSVPLDTFQRCPRTGGCVLVDRQSNRTVAAAVIEKAQAVNQNVVPHRMEITPRLRAAQKNQKPVCLWLTGLSGSGKSALADALDQKLVTAGKHTFVLDGDNLRVGLCRDLSFSAADRIENIRRISNVARLMLDAGLFVIVCAISPHSSERLSARQTVGDSEFVEIFVDTPLEVCERRDPKKLYQRARNGEIPDFTGISSPYEAPASPDIRTNHRLRPKEQAALVMQELELLA